MTTQITDLQTHCPPIAELFSPRNESEYDAAVERLSTLIDEIGTNQAHPLYSLLDTLSTLVYTYEADHHVIPDSSGPEVLSFLMEEHGVSVADFPEVGSSDSVEGYLAGRVELSVEQLRALARRFNISPAAFMAT